VTDGKLAMGLLLPVGPKTRIAIHALAIDGGYKCFVITTHPKSTLFIKNSQYTGMFLLYQVQRILIILELNHVPPDSLTDVFLLLKLEYKPIELLLKRLITVIDTKLFEYILLERFKPKDI